jgi:hypothetical protein
MYVITYTHIYVYIPIGSVNPLTTALPSIFLILDDIYMYIHMCIYMYIYIHICIYIYQSKPSHHSLIINILDP